ncbi:F-box only protein 36a [Brachyistius frenatus]|uniref:F-box only protein 36a n=1 Tax=Brachyistius frenatus TaxID=100188 RepID=UPI0037E78FE8
MASLLEGQLFQISGQGPPPAKDFFQLAITKNEIIWTSWKISLRLENRGIPPKQMKITHHDFQQHKMLQKEVFTVFGQRILEYTISLCEGKYDYLERLSDEILCRILSYLQLSDTAVVAQVSQRFRKLCNSEMFWKQTVRTCSAGFTRDMEDISNAMGWRTTYFTFFHVSNIKEQQ